MRRTPRPGAGSPGGRFCKSSANRSTAGTGVRHPRRVLLAPESRAAGADAARGLLVQPGHGRRGIQLMRVVGARRRRVAGGPPDRRADDGPREPHALQQRRVSANVVDNSGAAPIIGPVCHGRPDELARSARSIAYRRGRTFRRSNTEPGRGSAGSICIQRTPRSRPRRISPRRPRPRGPRVRRADASCDPEDVDRRGVSVRLQERRHPAPPTQVYIPGGGFLDLVLDAFDANHFVVGEYGLRSR